MFLILLAIKQQFKFPPHPMYASALPGKSKAGKTMHQNEQKVNKISYLQICGWQLLGE